MTRRFELLLKRHVPKAQEGGFELTFYLSG